MRIDNIGTDLLFREKPASYREYAYIEISRTKRKSDPLHASSYQYHASMEYHAFHEIESKLEAFISPFIIHFLGLFH